MDIAELLKNIKVEEKYEVITTWHEIPVKTKQKVKWVSVPDRLISFDFSGCKFKQAFSDEKVYVKLGELYLECDIFSNIRDELVLRVNMVSPPPPVVIREFVRVEPSKSKPVYVSFCVGEDCMVSAKAVDISESGVGVIISKEDVTKLLSSMLNSAEGEVYHKTFSMVIELPEEGSISALGKLKNIRSNNEDTHFRLGFNIELKPADLKKLRSYIMKRQREILDKLNSL
jgi:c-di-GMP-binding flagellar brake protein YcgR